MGIDALTAAFATLPSPAIGAAGVSRDRTESAARPEETSSSVPRVIFNPRSHFDTSAGVFVMEYRSASTGEVERQFPDENQLRAYANAKKLEAARAQGGSPVDPASEGADAPVRADSALVAGSAAAKGPAPVRLDI